VIRYDIQEYTSHMRALADLIHHRSLSEHWRPRRTHCN
jgi:hypothetical protein